MKARLLLTLLFATSATAQTTVNLNVTGTDAQVWANGTWKVTLKQKQGTTGGPPFNLITGGGFLSDQAGGLDPSGNASMALPANVNIAPAQSVWAFTVCPNASFPCFTQEITVGTSSPQAVNLTPPPISINILTVPPPVTAYTDSEIHGATQGTIYYNTTSLLYRQCNAAFSGVCTAWVGFGGTAVWSALTGVPPACTPGTFVTDIFTGTCAPATGGGSVTFDNIGTGTNTTATMTVAIGAQLRPDHVGGVVEASEMFFKGLKSGATDPGGVDFEIDSGSVLQPHNNGGGFGKITATHSNAGLPGNCVQLGLGQIFGTTAFPCGSGNGTVTNFSSGNLGSLFTTSVATSTTTPALSFSAISQASNLFYASPAASSGVPSFRAIASGDITTGDLPASTNNCTGGAGTYATGFSSGGSMICSTPTPGGPGFTKAQFIQITTGICTTSGGETTCALGPYSWPTAFASTSYAIVCTPTEISGGGGHPGIYSLRWNSKTTTQFSLTMQAGSNSAAGSNTTLEIDCIGMQ